MRTRWRACRWGLFGYVHEKVSHGRRQRISYVQVAGVTVLNQSLGSSPAGHGCCEAEYPGGMG